MKSNSFTKKWQRELNGEHMLENAEQVKSWNRYGVGMQVSILWSVTIAFILGFILCAVLLSLV